MAAGVAPLGHGLSHGPWVEFEGLHLRWPQGEAAAGGLYPGEALSGLSMSAPAGQVTILLGDRRSGASLVTRVLLGELAPDRGEVLVDWQSLWALPEHQRHQVRNNFGVLLDGTRIWESLIDTQASVRDNLLAQLARRGEDPAYADTVRECATQFDLAEVSECLPEQLDSAARRRLGVALALAADPPVVVIDNPGEAMDYHHLRHMVATLQSWHRRTRATVLMRVHSLAVAKELGQHIAVLRNGALVAQGPQDTMLAGIDDDLSFEQRFGTGLGGFAEADPVRLEHLGTEHRHGIGYYLDLLLFRPISPMQDSRPRGPHR